MGAATLHTKAIEAPPRLSPSVVMPSWMAELPSTRFTAKVHPNTDQITEDVHVFFLQHWPFPNDKARKKFVGGNFAYGLCATWPESTDERMRHACWLFTLLFLMDGIPMFFNCIFLVMTFCI
jgi:hypothetical protein